MPIDFFSFPCNNQAGNCEAQEIRCLQNFPNEIFGISDANARMPAFVMLNNQHEWDFTILNANRREVKYKAIDYCIDIYRTSTYDVYDENSDIDDFSSDSVGVDFIKRCEGFLFREDEGLLFFEIKSSSKGKWLTDARRKFEETILSFKEHHPDLAHLIIEPIVSNKLSYRTHQSEMIQKRILKDKIGVELKVQTTFTIQ